MEVHVTCEQCGEWQGEEFSAHQWYVDVQTILDDMEQVLSADNVATIADHESFRCPLCDQTDSEQVEGLLRELLTSHKLSWSIGSSSSKSTQPGIPFSQWPTPQDNNRIASILHARELDPYDIVEEHPFVTLKAYKKFSQLYHEESGYQLSIPQTLPYNQGQSNPRMIGNSLYVYADIIEDVTPIGDFAMGFAADPTGNIEARIGAMELRHYLHSEEFSERNFTKDNRGFGSAVIEHVSTVLKEQGIQRISLHSVGAGSYAWPSMGFEFDERYADRHSLLFSLADSMVRQAAEQPISKAQYQDFHSQIQGLVARSAAGENIQPIELGRCGQNTIVPTEPVHGSRPVALGRVCLMNNSLHLVKKL